MPANGRIRAAAFNQGGTPTIACMNKATVDLGVPFEPLIAALQKCYDTCFLPIWGYPVQLVINDHPAPDMWQLVFMDDADAAGALGYHDLTIEGQPVSKIFVKDTLKNKEKVSVTACHELFEMAIDPGAQLWAQGPKGLLYAYEMSDAVEDYTFEVDGIEMSDFVFPSFFEPWHKPGSIKFDYMGQVVRPFQTLLNGYQIIRNGKKVTEVFGSKAKERRFMKEDRRGHRSEVRKALARGHRK